MDSFLTLIHFSLMILSDACLYKYTKYDILSFQFFKILNIHFDLLSLKYVKFVGISLLMN